MERKAKKQQEEQNRAIAAASANAVSASSSAASTTPRVGGGAGAARKKRRWDDGGTPAAGNLGDGDETPAVSGGRTVSDWDADVATPVRPSFGGGETPGRTPGGRGGETPGRSRWDQTPSRDAQVTPSEGRVHAIARGRINML